MAKRKLYIYNPDSDNFERYYPTVGQKMRHALAFTATAAVAGLGFYMLMTLVLGSPTVRNLKHENQRLKAQYGVLQRRLDVATAVMNDISARDDNFYRVMMQMDPVSNGQRFAGLDNDSRYKELRRMGDASLALALSRGMDLLERQIYTQSQSFDQLKEAAQTQRDKLDHVPGIIPVKTHEYTLASGFGYRRDPVYGRTKLHEGLDFAAPLGTPVYATADGRVSSAGRRSGMGNSIEIDHGYNYATIYSNLGRMAVNTGQEVKRGQLIGHMGSTGRSAAPHLHYEVRYKDVPQNPVNYFYLDLTPERYRRMLEIADNAGHVMD